MDSARYAIGLDDTDAGDSIGTGALARELQALLARDLGARSAGVTRHQLLVHPDIPYTSHNSAACLVVDCPAPAAELAAACRRLVRFLFHPGADPGLCVVPAGRPPAGLEELARAAQQRVLAKDEALGCARAAGLWLEELGGSGLGVVGALAACGLRLGGEDGRFISLPGIREAAGRITAGELCRSTPIEAVTDGQGQELGPGVEIETRGWVRPALAGGRIVLEVELQGGQAQVVRPRNKQDW